jgi:hypothetical protein
VFTGITRDELKTWSIPDLGRVAKDYSSIDTQEQFYPLIKLNDKTYGYADISTMTLAEFIDLENLCKKPNANLHEIMAVLYREVKSHKFNNFIWNVKHNVQISRNKVDNVFKWYKLKNTIVQIELCRCHYNERITNIISIRSIKFFFSQPPVYII